MFSIVPKSESGTSAVLLRFIDSQNQLPGSAGFSGVYVNRSVREKK